MANARFDPLKIGSASEHRSQTIGASEVAALYDASPWLTRRQLWRAKAGIEPLPPVTHERARWGQRLEEAIALAVSEEHGWIVTRDQRWRRDDVEPRLSATPDYEARRPDRAELGVVECKNVSEASFRRDWGDEPPLHVLLQVQAQMAVAGREWGAVAALVGGHTLRVFEVERRDRIIADMRARVADFWRSIAAGEEPSEADKPDLDGLKATILGDVVDLRGNNRAPALCAELLAAQARRQAAEADEDALKAELRALLGDARGALIPGYSVRVSITPAKPARVITEDMVGQTLPGRSETRRLMVKAMEESVE